jgi:hypothetical protein
VNLHRGFLCTGFQEDDPPRTEIALPADWPEQNADVVSFRYTHPSVPDEVFYFKFLHAGENLEVNALSSARNDEIAHVEFK